MSSVKTLHDLTISEFIDEVEKQKKAPRLLDSAKSLASIKGYLQEIDPRLTYLQGTPQEAVGGTFITLVVELGKDEVCSFDITHSLDPEECDPCSGKESYTRDEVESAIRVGLHTLHQREVARRCTSR